MVSINNNTVTIKGLGTVNITAYNVENDTVAFASQVQILTINKASQSISFESLANKTYRDAPFVLQASTSASLPISFSASNTLVSINTNTVTIKGAGTVSITAYNVGNDTVAFASQAQILTINKASQSISFESLANKTYGDAPFVLQASTSAGLPISFSASNTLVSINTNTVTIKGAGTVSITAYNVGNDTVDFASQAQTLTINKASQSISFESLANKTYGDAPFVLQASTSAGLPISFSASNTLVSINNNTLTIKRVGTVSITAYNDINNFIAQNPVIQILTITEPNNPNKTNPTLTFTALPNLTIGQKYVLVATSNSPMPIIFSSTNTNILSISGNTATAGVTGSVTITARQEANAEYNAAIDQQSVSVVSCCSPPPLCCMPYIITSIEKENDAIIIHPNPAQDYITIQTNKTQKVASVKVYDITGKSYELGIRNYELGLRVDLKTLSKGEYIIILYGEKGEVLKTEKIIKE